MVTYFRKPILIISGYGRMSGKTTVTKAIIKYLKSLNIVVQPFKIGPDPVDAAVLALVALQRAVHRQYLGSTLPNASFGLPHSRVRADQRFVCTAIGARFTEPNLPVFGMILSGNSIFAPSAEAKRLVGHERISSHPFVQSGGYGFRQSTDLFGSELSPQRSGGCVSDCA